MNEIDVPASAIDGPTDAAGMASVAGDVTAPDALAPTGTPSTDIAEP